MMRVYNREVGPGLINVSLFVLRGESKKNGEEVKFMSFFRFTRLFRSVILSCCKPFLWLRPFMGSISRTLEPDTLRVGDGRSVCWWVEDDPRRPLFLPHGVRQYGNENTESGGSKIMCHLIKEWNKWPGIRRETFLCLFDKRKRCFPGSTTPN